MVSSLTFTSLSFRTSSFLNGWAFDLAQQEELLTTFGDQELENLEELETSYWIEESEKQSEIEKQHELQNLLRDQELEELLVDKSFPLDPLHDHLGKENLWSVQLQQIFWRMRRTKRRSRRSSLRPRMSFTRA